MAGLGDLKREYERVYFSEDRRLDVQGDSPNTARERALQWIQSRAHEAPGQELLIIVDRVEVPGRPPRAVARAVYTLLDELEGRLIDWWRPFTPGSVALRIAASPSVLSSPRARPTGVNEGEPWPGKAGHLAPTQDIPPELLAAVTRAAVLRIEREGLSPRLLDVVLREVWIEAQASAMEGRVSFAEAVKAAREREEARSIPE